MTENCDVTRLTVLVEAGDWDGVLETVRASPELLSARIGWAEQTPLHRAVIAGSQAAAVSLIEMGADVLARDAADNATPLHWAADCGHIEIGRLLLDHGADVNLADDAHGWGPLGWAVLGETPRPEMAGWLLDAGAEPTLFPLIALDDGLGLGELLTRRPAALSETMSLWEHHESPLHFAIAHGSAEAFRVLLDAGADVEALDWAGLSPLAMAHLKGRTAFVTELESAGARPDFSAGVATGHIDASGRENGGRAGADEGAVTHALADARAGSRYRRLLHYMAQHGHAEPASRLIDRGAEPDIVIDWWDNRVAPLHPAAGYGNIEVVRLLVERGADRTVRDAQFDGTPLAWARHFDRADIVSYLEELDT